MSMPESRREYSIDQVQSQRESWAVMRSQPIGTGRDPCCENAKPWVDDQGARGRSRPDNLFLPQRLRASYLGLECPVLAIPRPKWSAP